MVKERFTKYAKKLVEIRGNFGLSFHYLLIRVKNVNTGRIILKDNGKIIKEQNEVAETLNAYFTNSANLHHPRY